MSEPGKAVFLSYASQDADATRRIAEALRAAGLEVWFDQSELRGGDAWDVKIRKQIKECALFVPVISANTQARAEGYFRLEWKLAVDRSHLMADDAPFLFPVVIDDTSDAAARVPEKFRERQWTRLDVKDTPESLARRVARLLTDDLEAMAGTARAVTDDDRPARRRNRKRPKSWIGRAWLVVGLSCSIFYGFWPIARMLLRDLFGLWKPAAAAPAAASEAGQLAARARAITTGSSLTRAQLDTASELCDRALALDPADASAWTEAARVDLLFIHPYGYDGSEQRRKQALSRAARAITLAPDAFDTRVVHAAVLAHASNSPALQGEAEATFRELIASRPDDTELKVQLAEVLREQKRYREAAALFEEIGDHELAGWSYHVAGQQRTALAAVERALSQKRTATALMLKAIIQQSALEDLDTAQATIDQIRPSELLSEMPASVAASIALFRRDAPRVFEIIAALPQDFLDSNALYAPKQFLTGLAHEMSGEKEAAAAAWRAGLAAVDHRLKSEPDERRLLLWKAWLQASHGNTSDATSLLVRQDLAGLPPDEADDWSAMVFLRLGRDDVVLDYLARVFRERKPRWESIHAEARFAPNYDHLRDNLRFDQLLRDNLPEGAKPFEDMVEK